MALKVGDRVGSTKGNEWHRHGTLTAIDGTKPKPYRVHWDDGDVQWHLLWQIRKL
jgi:hypothetical protein